MAFRIGNVTMENPLVLGPMAGVTDLPFRLLCKEMGCGLVYTEMISAKALYYKNKNTLPLLATDEKEQPIAVQLFGSEPELMADMAKTLEDKGRTNHRNHGKGSETSGDGKNPERIR